MSPKYKAGKLILIYLINLIVQIPLQKIKNNLKRWVQIRKRKNWLDFN